MLLAAAPIAERPSVSIIPAPMNTMAYSFTSINRVNFVRSTGIVMKKRLPTQAATRIKENNSLQAILKEQYLLTYVEQPDLLGKTEDDNTDNKSERTQH